jgi:hypothetical protein
MRSGQGSRWRGPFAGGLAIGALLVALAAPAAGEQFVGLAFGYPTPTSDMTPATIYFSDQQLLSAPAFLPPPGKNAIFHSLTRNPSTGEFFTLESNFLFKVDIDHVTTALVGQLPAFMTDIAFDGNGNLFAWAHCDSTYANELFQIDPTTGAATGVLASLDSTRLAPCGSSGGIYPAGTMTIDQTSNVLYLTGADTTGAIFIDSFDSSYVPTLLFSEKFVTLGAATLAPFASTFADGQLWISISTLDLFTVGEGFIGSFDPLNAGINLENGAFSYPYSFYLSTALYGLFVAPTHCTPSPTAACLYNRFLIQATYDATPTNGKGPATVLLESSQSVKFAFFDAGNVELVLKVLDACVAPFHRWWVAGGGLTNVGVTITVTDTFNGKVKTYSSKKNTLFQTFFDTNAFVCP